jgi:ribosomal protein S18 acetylase RimI-like enzyme
MKTFLLNQSDTVSLEAHLQRCDQLFMPTLSSRISLMAYAEKMKANAMLFECHVNDQLVGLVAMYANDPSKTCAHITNVSLELEYQRQGIAQTLLENAIAFARQHHFLRINLQVNPKNTQAMKLYLKFGFTINPPVKADDVEMTLTLTKNETRL